MTDLKEIKKAKYLTDLNIIDLKVTDNGLKELCNVKSLMALHVRQPKFGDEFTERGMNELKRTLPDLEFIPASRTVHFNIVSALGLR